VCFDTVIIPRLAAFVKKNRGCNAFLPQKRLFLWIKSPKIKNAHHPPSLRKDVISLTVRRIRFFGVQMGEPAKRLLDSIPIIPHLVRFVNTQL
jgi:hypothetical protein